MMSVEAGQPASPIDLYTAGTPNGQKISCTLEELGVPYTVHKIDLSKDEQKQSWYLTINPNGRIPAILDQGKRIFEGAAIQLYLCEKYDRPRGHRISFPYDSPEYWEMVEWLVWMQSGLGPMQGQANHFHRYAPEKIPYGIQRYQNETRRLYRVLETRLHEQAGLHRTPNAAYLVGGKFTIADLACFSWVNWAEWAGIRLTADEFPHLTRWVEDITARPAVGRGLDVPEPFEMKKAMQSSKGEEAFAKYHADWVMKGMNDDEKK